MFQQVWLKFLQQWLPSWEAGLHSVSHQPKLPCHRQDQARSCQLSRIPSHCSSWYLEYLRLLVPRYLEHLRALWGVSRSQGEDPASSGWIMAMLLTMQPLWISGPAPHFVYILCTCQNAIASANWNKVKEKTLKMLSEFNFCVPVKLPEFAKCYHLGRRLSWHGSCRWVPYSQHDTDAKAPVPIERRRYTSPALVLQVHKSRILWYGARRNLNAAPALVWVVGENILSETDSARSIIFLSPSGAWFF